MRNRRAPTEPDPADQGTAYGMELTLGRAARVEPPTQRSPGWWERIGRGHKTR